MADADLAALAPALDAAVSDFVETNGVPGACAGLVHRGELAWASGAGRLGAPGTPSPDRGTCFRIASITKTFTATAIVWLRDHGQLDLDDPLVRHLPEFGAAQDPFGPIEAVTLRRLLRHTSGLQGEPPGTGDTPEWTLPHRDGYAALMQHMRVVAPPDTSFRYSNLGYHLLGEVVARVSGLSLDEFIAQRLAGPLGMADTTMDPARLAEAPLARGHRAARDGGPPQPAIAIELGYTEGAGGLWSTVADLARWIAFHMRAPDDDGIDPCGVLAAGSLAELRRPMVVADADLERARGLAWSSSRWEGTRWFGHSGWVAGFTSQVMFEPERGIGVIALANGIGRPQGVEALVARIRELVWPHLPSEGRAGRSHAVPMSGEGTGGPSDPLRRRLLGRYQEDEAAKWIELVELGGTLAIAEDGEAPGPLVPTADPLLFLTTGPRSNEHVRFHLDGDGRAAFVDLAGYPYVRSPS